MEPSRKVLTFDWDLRSGLEIVLRSINCVRRFCLSCKRLRSDKKGHDFHLHTDGRIDRAENLKSVQLTASW